MVAPLMTQGLFMSKRTRMNLERRWEVLGEPFAKTECVKEREAVSFNRIAITTGAQFW